MDEKTLQTLEFPKILDRLAGYCAFSASASLARELRPTPDLETARQRQAQVTEARRMLVIQPEISIGGARDVREVLAAAVREAVLLPSDLLDVKSTLVSARNLARLFERQVEPFPHLAEMAARLPTGLGLVDAITRALSDRGEVLDTASPRLAAIRSELRVAHDRLLSRMQRMVNSPEIAPYLQDNVVTQRDGRYVLPLRAEFKGRIQAVVHDQSSSGATLFVEPLSMVDHNNRYRELQLEERDEQQWVLAALSRQVGEQAEAVNAAVETLAALDLALARAKYAETLEAVEPRLEDFRRPGRGAPAGQFPHPGSTLKLWRARHPLLDPDKVVAIDLELDPDTFALVITGPNTGGKTVTLKTAGLLAVMAQAGLHIPALEGSQLSVFQAVFADIGDEQSIEQSLSTFSGHITTIIRILGEADARSLVILDELGAGTDPQEGSALARAILGQLLARGITTLVATHYPELKAFAHTTPGVVNASVEFDLESLSPTYRLTVGLPGRSNALAIAQRLGLPEEIVAGARQGLDPTDLRAEDLLDEIHRQRDLARQDRAAAGAARREAEGLRAELVERLEGLETERREVLEAARQEAEDQLAQLRAELKDLRRELRQARQPLEDLAAAEEQLQALEETVEVPVPRRGREELAVPGAPDRPIQLGDRVRLRTLGTLGVIGSLGDEQAEVQVGNLRVRAHLADLELVSGPEVETPPGGQEAAVSVSAPASPGLELDLRGRRVDEALDALDRYLDSAYLAGLPFVRVIHGKGTGRLREAVRRELQGHPHVISFEAGQAAEGGEGVTVARLKGV